MDSGEGGGTRPPPFTLFTITYKVAVYAPAERADTLPQFHLYPYNGASKYTIVLYHFQSAVVDGNPWILYSEERFQGFLAYLEEGR